MRTINAVRININGSVERVSIEEKDGMCLQSLYGAIGNGCDTIEFVPVTEECHAYVDEEGKLKDGVPNLKATSFFSEMEVGLSPHDIIVGNVILLGSDDEGGEADCPESIVQRLGL